MTDEMYDLFETRSNLTYQYNCFVEPIISTGKYIQLVVDTILTFIMGQPVESLYTHEEYQSIETVNAVACDLMEQVLKALKDNKDLSQEITHLVLKPIVKCLQLAIENDNTSQQLELIQLIQHMIVKSNFWSPKLKSKEDEQSQNALKSAVDLFNNKTFLKCVGDGLRNKDSFVRKHYIKFAQKIVLPNLLKILTK